MGLFGLHVTVAGIEAAQAAQFQLLAAVNPRGGLGRAVKVATEFVRDYAVAITHVQTGTLRASHRADFASGRLLTTFAAITIREEAMGRIYIDPSVRNPVTGQLPSEYGFAEHSKGGSHAFYYRAHQEAGPTALALAHNVMMTELPKGQAVGGILYSGRSVFALLPGNAGE